MIKSLKRYAFLIIISFTSSLFAQKTWLYENNLNSYKDFFKDSLGINITYPKGFNTLDVYKVGFKVSKDPKKPTGSAFGTFILSEDENCMIAFPMLLFGFTSEIPKEKKPTAINTFSFKPKSQVISEIKIVLDMYYHPFWSENDKNKEVAFDVYKYADFIFGRQARDKFNADGYSISDIPKVDEFEFFSLRGQSIENLPINKFSYCTSLFIQKDEKALEIKFFFTEKGLENKEKYLKTLDKHIWFD